MASPLSRTDQPPTRVLVIGYVWPEPRSSAAGYRMLSLIQAFLAQGWQVDFATPAQASPRQADLPALGVGVHEIRLNCRSFDVFVTGLAPDIVLFDRFMMEEQFGWRVEQACPQALRVLNTEDLHALREARQRHLKKTLMTEKEAQEAVPRCTENALYALMASHDLALREVAAIFRCDLTLMISTFEMALLTDGFRVPAQLLHYCPFLFDTRAGPWPGWEARQHFVSIGNFRHAPNRDAVLWLQQRIWPAVRRQLPDAELHVYGAYPSPAMMQLHNPRHGFLVKGEASEVDAVMLAARLCLAPLRFGAGIKGKLADAMRCGTPSITTAIGSESMTGTEGWPGAVADEAETLVAQAVHLYQHRTSWEQAQQRCALTLTQRFDRKQHEPALIAAINRVHGTLAQHRLANFTGAMLRHHQHQSTRYMAQWIEAKNRHSD